MIRRYEKRILVASEHLDALAHVNNVRYLSWVQDIAQEHWNVLSPQFDLDGYWVVREHHITYKKPAVLGDVLIVQTYINNFRGPLSERIVTFSRESGESVVECSTQWCLLHSKTHRPVRIPTDVVDKVMG